MCCFSSTANTRQLPAHKNVLWSQARNLILVIEYCTKELDDQFIFKHSDEIHEETLHASHALFTKICSGDLILAHILHEYCLFAHNKKSRVLSAEEMQPPSLDGVQKMKMASDNTDQEVSRKALVDSLCPAVISRMRITKSNVMRIRDDIVADGPSEFNAANFGNIRGALQLHVCRSARLLDSLRTWESTQKEGLGKATNLHDEIQDIAREAMISLQSLTIGRANPVTPKQVHTTVTYL
jgi:hypothetical protein